MPWVRIDEHALNHVKLLALSDGAFRLWVEGLAHCQRHLTDGTVSRSSLRTFRYVRPGRVAELTTSVDGASALWAMTPDGYQVHDYLQWNEDRIKVEVKRERARERMARLRGCSPPRSREQTSEHSENVRGTTTTTTTTSHVPTEQKSVRRAVNPTDSPSASMRAGDFVERYQDLHLQYRGVAYLGNPRKDYDEALQLVQAYDDETLGRLATVFLNADDPFSRSGTATIGKFRSRASWCQERLNAELQRRGIA